MLSWRPQNGRRIACNGGGGVNLREYAARQTKATEGNTEAAAGIVAADNSVKTAGATPPQLPDRYKRIYRAVFDFHARHTPAPQTLEEWTQAAADIGQTSCTLDNDPFVMDLLTAVYNELTRQDKARSAAPAELPTNPEQGF